MNSVTLIILSLAVASQAAVLPKLDFNPRLPGGGRIVGGNAVKIEDIPYQVSLFKSRHACGGSIISNQWILSAAHCVENLAPEKLQIRVGSSFSTKDGQMLKVSKIISHPKWNNKTTDYDYTLIELSEPITLDNKTTKAVGLPKQGEKLEVNTKCLVSGWGNTQSTIESSEQLRSVEVPVVDSKECKKSYKKLTDRMICAGLKEGGKDSCQGDSGGPFVCDNKLYGVVSFGKGCALPGFPGVYANVAYVRDWIKKVTNL